MPILACSAAWATWMVLLVVTTFNDPASAQSAPKNSNGTRLPGSSPLPGRSNTGSATKPVTTTVYLNGLAAGWHDGSYGCANCNFIDNINKRDKSSPLTASITAKVASWGALIFAADKPFHPQNSALDFWIKGSGVTAVSMYVEDTVSRRYSSDLRFTRPDLLNQTFLNVYGSDDNGWIHVAVDLSKLVNATALDIKNLAKTQTYNRIVFKDISGAGYNIQLDAIKLVQTSALTPFNAASFFDPLQLLRPMTLPVFGQDLVQQASSPTRFIARLKSGIQLNAISNICAELSGRLPNQRRFKGFCDQSTFGWLKSATQSLSGPTNWRFITINVNSEADLQSMRMNLGASVDYFEQDLIAHATPVTIHSTTAATAPAPAASPTAATAKASPAPSNVSSTVPKPSPKPSPVPSPKASPKAHVPPPAGTPDDHMVGSIQPVPLGNTNFTVAEAIGSIQVSVNSWGLDRIDQVNLPMDGLYAPGNLDGNGVHVYVIDTGLRASHYDFRGRVGEGTSMLGGSYNDDNGHGTHAAGTAVGAIHGVARGAILHPIKVLDSQGSGSYSNIINGMRWAKNHKLTNNIASAVVSLSLGGPRSASLNDAVDDLAAAGITVVVAAGNNNRADACSSSPGSSSNAITVGASTQQDGLASFSNIGSCLAIFAPGAYITSAGISSDSAESTMSGTSMACPHVAGAAALYLQYNPGASPAAVRRALVNAAIPITFDASSPRGLLDVIASRLNAGRPGPTPTSTPAPAPAPTPAPWPAPAPTPAAPAPAPSGFTPLPMPSFGTVPSWCATCPWCTFCK